MPEWVIAYALIPIFYILLFLLIRVLMKEPTPARPPQQQAEPAPQQ